MKQTLGSVCLSPLSSGTWEAQISYVPVSASSPPFPSL